MCPRPFATGGGRRRACFLQEGVPDHRRRGARPRCSPGAHRTRSLSCRSRTSRRWPTSPRLMPRAVPTQARHRPAQPSSRTSRRRATRRAWQPRSPSAWARTSSPSRQPSPTQRRTSTTTMTAPARASSARTGPIPSSHKSRPTAGPATTRPFSATRSGGARRPRRCARSWRATTLPVRPWCRFARRVRRASGVAPMPLRSSLAPETGSRASAFPRVPVTRRLSGPAGLEL